MIHALVAIALFAMPTPAAIGRKQTTGSKSVQGGLPTVDATKLAPLDFSRLPKGQNGEKIVAIVNGHEVPLRRLKFQIARMAGRQNSNVPEQMKSVLVAPAMDEVIANALIREYATANGLDVTEAEITSAVHENEARLPAGRKLADEIILMGMGREDLREFVRDELLKARVSRHVSRDAQYADQQSMERFVASQNLNTTPTVMLRASHIFFAAPTTSTEVRARVRGEAQQVMSELREGKLEFVDAARKYSQDSETGPLSGDIGFFKRGQLPPQLEEAAYNMRDGETTGPVETRLGFHILKITGRAPNNAPEVYITIQRKLFFEDWLRQTRAAAVVEKYL